MNEIQDQTKYMDKEIGFIFSNNDKTISFNTEKKIDKIITEETSTEAIISSVVSRYKKIDEHISIVDGFIYQKIIETNNKKLIDKLKNHLPKGVINLEKYREINYQPLQELLITQNFQEADKLTQKYLCELVEKQTNKRKQWLYFTDISFIPVNELFIIDLLWKTYSKGKFGFSVQKDIWIKYNSKWDKLWEKIKWSEMTTGTMKRYPQEFIWTIDAPEGHLPLFNQLRGTQTLSYLFKKINW